jgi:hypothetical protein
VIANNKHPKSGIVSIMMSSVALLMLLNEISLVVIAESHMQKRDIMALIWLFKLDISFAIIAIISGLIGIRRPRKILSVLGLLLAGLFFIIFTAVMIAA